MKKKQFNKEGEYVGNKLELNEVELGKKANRTMLINVGYGVLIVVMFLTYMYGIDWLLGW